MIKILTVCLGNICRSPLAEELLRRKCTDLGLRVQVDSAGTSNYHVGSPPDKRMIRIAGKFGYNIAHLRARQFSPDDFDNFDYILVMDESNKRNVLALCKNPDHRSKVLSFQYFAGIHTPDFVPDPYYGDENDFLNTFRIVEQSAESIAQKLFKLRPS
jgi:protein-tyrosine phosphatase